MKFAPREIIIDEFASIKSLRVRLDRAPGLYFMWGTNEVEPTLETNGAGKSTIWNALAWALFGTTVDGLRGPDVVPWEGGGRPLVTVQFDLDDAPHQVQRGANPNKLNLDGADIDPLALQRHLGMNYDTYTHTQILGQDRTQSPLFFDLPPRGKLQLFTDALDLERWDRRSKLADDAAKTLRRQIDEDKGRLDGLLAQYREVKGLHQSTKEQFEQWDAALQLRLQTREAELQKLADSLKKAQRKHDDANLAYDSAGTELAPLDREIEQLEHYITHNRTERANAEMRLSRARATAQELARGMQAGTCPTCGQELHSKKQITAEKRKADDEIKTADGELKVAKQAGIELTNQWQPLTQARDRFRDQVTRSRMALDFCVPVVAELKAAIKRIKDERQETSNAINPFGQQLDDLRRRRDQLAVEHKRHKEKLQSDGEKLDRLQFWIKGFKDLKLSIIEEVLQEQELCTNAKLEQFGLIGWSTKYAVERETKTGGTVRGLDVRIISPKTPDRAVPFAAFSGGEAQRLRIVGALALGEVLLNRAGIEPTLEVLDEPSQSLSPQGVQDLVDYLAERAQQLQRTIIYVDQTVISQPSSPDG